jgi:hypothetical protein
LLKLYQSEFIKNWPPQSPGLLSSGLPIWGSLAENVFMVGVR